MDVCGLLILGLGFTRVSLTKKFCDRGHEKIKSFAQV